MSSKRQYLKCLYLSAVVLLRFTVSIAVLVAAAANIVITKCVQCTK